MGPVRVETDARRGSQSRVERVLERPDAARSTGVAPRTADRAVEIPGASSPEDAGVQATLSVLRPAGGGELGRVPVL
jgi:hypothetical protein